VALPTAAVSLLACRRLLHCQACTAVALPVFAWQQQQQKWSEPYLYWVCVYALALSCMISICMQLILPAWLATVELLMSSCMCLLHK
jgi:hypothetical protein